MTLAVKMLLPFELICAVYFKYIVTIPFFRPYPNLLALYVQYTKNQAVKKWLPFKLVCAVHFEYIVTINFDHPYPKLLTSYSQYTKNLAVKKGLPFELICAVYLEYIVQCPYNTHFLVPFGPIFQIFLTFCSTFFSMSGNFFTVREPPYGEKFENISE